MKSIKTSSLYQPSCGITVQPSAPVAAPPSTGGEPINYEQQVRMLTIIIDSLLKHTLSEDCVYMALQNAVMEGVEVGIPRAEAVRIARISHETWIARMRRNPLYQGLSS